jgi:signal transduction histidine kinase
MLPCVDSNPDAVLPRAVDLHRQIRGIVTAVVLLSRVTSLGMVALSIAALVRGDGYTNPPLAVATYTAVALWNVAYLPLVGRRDPIPRWVLVCDVAVTAAAVVTLPWAIRGALATNVAIPDFEALTVAAVVAVALVSASVRGTVAACLTLAGAYAAAQLPGPGHQDIPSTLNVIGWQVATASCACLFTRRLRAVADAVDTATEQVVAARERLAARRTQAEERIRHFHERLRRYRALHDGPLRLLTAIAGPGPAGHQDPAIRRQAAVSAHVLRGATPDHPDGTLTDLSIALIEAGNDSAMRGLRVEYHFANLPDTLPPEVVDAFRQASSEALANVANHAGTNRARLTARAAGDSGQPVVTVAIVDQGTGFDVARTPPGYGIRHSITARMAEVGGTSTVDSHPGDGTRVDLRWPG